MPVKEDTQLLKDAEFKPCFCAVMIDETGGYVGSEDLIDRCGGKIYGVYVYDRNEVTHICSFTPSYLLYYIESVGEVFIEDDDHDTLEEANRENHADYFNCSTIDQIASEYPNRHSILQDFSEPDMPLEITYDDALEGTLEYARGNSPF